MRTDAHPMMQKREWENPALWSVMDRAGGRPVDRRAYEASLRSDPCAYCGDTAGPADIDHIEPRKGNGANTWHNLTAACPRCNSSKNAKPLLRWLASRGS